MSQSSTSSCLVVRTLALAVLLSAASPAVAQTCQLYTETFPFGGPADFDNGTFRVEWCTAGTSISSAQFCGTGTALRMNSSTQDPILWVYVDSQGCSQVTLEFDYSQFSATGTLLKAVVTSDTTLNCSESITTSYGALSTTGGQCVHVTHPVSLSAGVQSVYWKFDHGTPSTNAIYIDNVTITLTGCDCTGGGDHDCCEVGGPGCNDATVQACVCAQDSYCCETEWDAQCVAEVDSFGCGDCGGAGGCIVDFAIDFGSFFQSGRVCDLWPQLFASCEGSAGPYISSGTACGGAGDYVMTFPSGFPYTAAVTGCIEFTSSPTARLTFNYSKSDGTLGPRIDASVDDGAFTTIWNAPISHPGGCTPGCVDLSQFAGETNVRLRFSSGTSLTQTHSFDDIVLTQGATCPATRACCFDNGYCLDLSNANCLSVGGAPQAIGSTCAGTTCVTCTAPSADAGPDKWLCAGGIVMLEGSASGGDGGDCPGDYSPSWTGPGIVSGGDTFTPMVNAAGTYVLTAACDDCEDTDGVIVSAVTFLSGDVNNDGLINGKDVQAFVDVILGSNLSLQGRCAADLDSSGEVDLADISAFVAMLLGV